MRRQFMMGVISFTLCLAAADQRPSAEEQQRTLNAAREIAIHYGGKLPDFICAEEVTRSDSISGRNNKIDKLTIQLGYSGQKEKYKLTAMNGRPTEERLESLEGLITGGEFGSLQLGVFDPASAADFQWKGWATVRKARAAVFTYRIARAHSHYMLGRRAGDGKLESEAAGYHGEVWLEAAQAGRPTPPGTARVLRLTAVADDMPKDSGILQSSVEVDYDSIDIGGRSYLLPSRSESHMERGYRQIGNTVAFTKYRKFEAESTIDFGKE